MSKLEINNSIVTRKETYPREFYQIIEKLDIIVRNWVGDDMGSDGTDELFWLAGIFAVDYNLGYNLPKPARAFFYTLVNPKNSWKYLHESGNIMGNNLSAYAQLRQFLIDNAERVTLAYNKLYEASEEFRGELLKNE